LEAIADELERSLMEIWIVTVSWIESDGRPEQVSRHVSAMDATGAIRTAEGALDLLSCCEVSSVAAPLGDLASFIATPDEQLEELAEGLALARRWMFKNPHNGVSTCPNPISRASLAQRRVDEIMAKWSVKA
jgi:hypothetical protein